MGGWSDKCPRCGEWFTERSAFAGHMTGCGTQDTPTPAGKADNLYAEVCRLRARIEAAEVVSGNALCEIARLKSALIEINRIGSMTRGEIRAYQGTRVGNMIRVAREALA